MATRGIAQTIPFVAWDSDNQAGKTGDGSNFTLRWIKDGVSAALTTTTVTEVDSTNLPGVYKVSVSASEADCNIGMLAGKSSTAKIAIIPVTIQFERLPDAAPTAAGGVLDTTRFGGTSVTGRDLGASVVVGTNNDKTGYGLTSGERTSIANEVEAQIIDDTDSEKVLNAITDKIASVNPSLAGLTLSAIASAVWSAVTRTLTAGTNIVLAKGTGVTGFNDLDASGIRTAVGLASANLDTQLGAIPTNSEMDAYFATVQTSLDEIAGAAAPTVEEIDAHLSSQHGDTPWGAAVNYITPLSVTVGLGEASAFGNLVAYLHGPLPSGPFAISDSAGTAVNLNGATLTLIGWKVTDHSDLFVLRSTDGQLVVGGSQHNQVTIVSGIDYGESAGQYELFLQNQSDNGRMIGIGGLTVFEAPELPT